MRQRITEISETAEILPVKVDLKSEGEVEEMIAKTASWFGRVDYAVNAAGRLFCPNNPMNISCGSNSLFFVTKGENLIIIILFRNL